MAFSTQAIKYGWVALASLGVLTGTTIYVANNQRKQVKPVDIIQPVLGTYERCLALQYSTNPVAYYVTPPSFVRTWYSNVYTTNGVTVYTNIVTNTIGWHIDRAMMVSLDTTIKALVPYYCDTNTVYDGTTNIVMLTVTGLWASLGIGNKTNLFTREPCWTNSVSTNWIVNYTSYWPSTNGTATNICYTSDYRQVVNYAQSWTATGGHVWVSASNWASSAVTVTNVATYGDYSWQIYAEDLQERYKVLNALKMCHYTTNVVTNAPPVPGLSPRWRGTYFMGGGYFVGFSWEGARLYAESDFGTSPYYMTTNSSFGPVSYSFQGYYYDYEYGWIMWLLIYASDGKYEIGPFPTNQTHSVIVQARSVAYMDGYTSAGEIANENEWITLINTTNSLSVWEYSDSYGGNAMPVWCVEPTDVNVPHGTGNVNEVIYQTWYGPQPTYTNLITNYIPVGTNINYFTNYPDFQYCTNSL